MRRKINRELSRDEMIALGVWDKTGKPIPLHTPIASLLDVPGGEKEEEKAQAEGAPRQWLDEAARTVELSFSSEDPYERWFGIEILDHGQKSVRMGRLQSKTAAFLLQHDVNQQVGVIEKAAIRNRRGTAVGRFGPSALAEEIFQDVRARVRSLTSVSYIPHRMVLEEESDESPNVYRVTDWEPLEISIVAVPADATVGIGRGGWPTPMIEEEKKEPAKEECVMRFCEFCGKPKDECKGECEGARAARAVPGGSVPPPSPPPAPAPIVNIEEALSHDRRRTSNILALGEKWGEKEFAREAANGGMSLDEFGRKLMEKVGAKQVPMSPEAPMLGMSEKQLRRFSFFRLLRHLSDKTNPKLASEAGLEMEACREWAKKSGRDTAGALIPPDILFRAPWLKTGQDGHLERARITEAGEGADLTPTEYAGEAFIEYLRASTPVLQNATIFSGLVGDLLIPRQNAAATAAFTQYEYTAASESEATFDQILMQPKRIAAYSEVTRRTLLQASLGVENLIRNDLVTAVVQKLCQVLINGKNTSYEPVGILNTSGIGSVTVGGVALGWDDVVNLETEVAIDNALTSRAVYLTNPNVRGQAKRTAIVSNYPEMLWSRENSANPLNGYPCLVTTNVPKNLGTGTNRSALIFGDLSALLVAFWGSMEILVNPYILDTIGVIRLVIQHEADCALRHVENFAAAVDIDHAA